MIIGVIGPRNRQSMRDRNNIEILIMYVYNRDRNDRLCSGGCSFGADKFAEQVAKKRGIPITIFWPDWETSGKGAAFIRNAEIAKESDILIARIANPRTNGTQSTINYFTKKQSGILYELNDNDIITKTIWAVGVKDITTFSLFDINKDDKKDDKDVWSFNI